MHALKRLGCLLALVFAGASAFAEEVDEIVQPWFDAGVGTSLVGWSGLSSWTMVDGFSDITSWETPIAYQAATSQNVKGKDVEIATQVKFSAMDYADLVSKDITGAKAGLTVAEDGNQAAAYYGLVGGDTWVKLSGTNVVTDAVDVKVTFATNGVGGTVVSYSIGDTTLYDDNGNIFFAVTNEYADVRTVQYIGQVKIASLTGAYDEYARDIEPQLGDDQPPVTVDLNEMQRRLGSTDTATIQNYLYTRQVGEGKNGQYGWVNYSLGIADTDVIAPTNEAQNVAGKIAVNFGINPTADANVQYKVGDATTKSSVAEIALGDKAANTKVVDIEMYVKDKYVTTVSVGVMETGKQGPATGKTFDIVAVPWESMGGGDVTVNNLLNTAYLKNGDTLYIWNQTAGLYDTYVWTVPQEGVPYWNPGTQTIRDSATGKTAATSEAPATKTIAKNTAIWIERDTTSRIVFAGIVTDKTAKYTATVAAGGEKDATWSLIANPSIKQFDLSSIVGAEGDMIIVEDAADPREYTYENGAWGYMKKTGFEEKKGPRGMIRIPRFERCLDAIIPAGVGFWYVRAAKGPAFEITFGDNDVSKN